MEVLIRVEGKRIWLDTIPVVLASDSQEFVKFIFEITSDWNGLSTYAQFIQNDNTYKAYLDSENSVYIPSGVANGYCLMSLCGTNANRVVMTNAVKFIVHNNEVIFNEENTEISESLYQEIINLILDKDFYYSPILKGIPTAPTAEVGTNTLQIANAEFVHNSINACIANNLTTEDEGYVLDARQGKILNDTKANLDSPSFTGVPRAPTPSIESNTNQIATTQFVHTVINNSIVNNLETEDMGYALDARQGKILNDSINELSEIKINISSIADNLTTETEGYVLSARQGKILNDLIVSLDNTKLDKANIADNLTTNEDGYALSAKQGKILYDLASTKVSLSAIADNLTTTDDGYVLDAKQGKILNDLINSKVNISDISNDLTTTGEGHVLDARQGKILNDAINGKVNASSVVNNLTTTATGYVLDARQGRLLNDSITELQSKFNGSSTADFKSDIRFMPKASDGITPVISWYYQSGLMKSSLDMSPYYLGTPDGPNYRLYDYNGNLLYNGELGLSYSPITATGSATVNAAASFNVCSATIPKGTGYWVLFGHVYSSVSSSESLSANFIGSNIGTITSRRAKGPMLYGGGVWTVATMKASETYNGTVTLQSYGYYKTSHTEYGLIMAVHF